MLTTTEATPDADALPADEHWCSLPDRCACTADPYDSVVPGDPNPPDEPGPACWVLIPHGDAAIGCTRTDGHHGQHVAQGAEQVLAVQAREET